MSLGGSGSYQRKGFSGRLTEAQKPMKVEAARRGGGKKVGQSLIGCWRGRLELCPHGTIATRSAWYNLSTVVRRLAAGAMDDSNGRRVRRSRRVAKSSESVLASVGESPAEVKKGASSGDDKVANVTPSVDTDAEDVVMMKIGERPAKKRKGAVVKRAGKRARK